MATLPSDQHEVCSTSRLPLFYSLCYFAKQYLMTFSSAAAVLACWSLRLRLALEMSYGCSVLYPLELQVQRNRDAVLIRATQLHLCSKCNSRKRTRSIGGGLRPTDVSDVLAGQNYLAPWTEITRRVPEVPGDVCIPCSFSVLGCSL